MYKALIFSDLDGTLLHYKTFNFDILINYIQYLEKNGYLLIPISSKTNNEIMSIIKKIRINLPFSVENGSCSYIPRDFIKNKKKRFVYNKIESKNAKNIKYINNIINSKKFELFRKKLKILSKLNYEEITKITSLKHKDIDSFLNREFSVPIIWFGNKVQLLNFAKELNKHKLDINFGGKIYNISGMSKKIDGIKVITNYLKKELLIKNKFFTIGVGDSENDINMLEYTDYSAIIKKYDGTHLNLKSKNVYAKSTKIAPLGWKEVITKIYKKMEK